MLSALKRVWVPVVVLVAVALGAVAVVQLRGAFASEPIFTATGSDARPLEATHVKRVTYEVYGPAGAVGSVSYLDQDAKSERADFTGLPWTHTVSTTASAVLANVVAQGDTNSIGCRITVDGRVLDEQSASGRNAQTSCLVKAA